MNLYIKDMVCDRCITAVQQTLEKLGYTLLSIRLGEVQLVETLDESQILEVNQALIKLGFELLDDKRKQIVERVKIVVRDLIYSEPESLKKLTPSVFIADNVGKDYKYLSGLFSEAEGITIEHYMIHLKIEKVKELLVYDVLSLSQIADQLYYSSVQHLSSQFKKNTGLTPSNFKQLKSKIKYN